MTVEYPIAVFVCALLVWAWKKRLTTRLWCWNNSVCFICLRQATYSSDYPGGPFRPYCDRCNGNKKAMKDQRIKDKFKRKMEHLAKERGIKW